MKSELTITLFCAAILSGCALIFPIPHDPVMFNNLVETKIIVDKLNCDDKNWDKADISIERLKLYTTLREDPQADTVIKLQEAMTKAKESTNKTFCESVLKIQRIRIDVIVKAWGGR